MASTVNVRLFEVNDERRRIGFGAEGPRSGATRSTGDLVALPSPRMDDPVTVASFPDVAEAQLAKERLELEGIVAFVIDAQTAGVMPYLTSSTGGVRVQVKRSDAARAREILSS
jgi:putative signal transducing protein